MDGRRWGGFRGDLRVQGGAPPNDEVTIQASSILELLHDGFVVEMEGSRTYIPYHRVVLIRSKSGEVLLDRRRR